MEAVVQRGHVGDLEHARSGHVAERVDPTPCDARPLVRTQDDADGGTAVDHFAYGRHRVDPTREPPQDPPRTVRQVSGNRVEHSFIPERPEEPPRRDSGNGLLGPCLLYTS